MKKIVYIISILCFALYAKAQCPNGNSELGNFTYWKTYSGSYSTSLNMFSSPAPASRVTLIGPGYNDAMITANVDNYGGFPVPNEGSYAFRIGNSTAGAEADAMSYKFVVTPVNAHFKFRYAVVLNDAGHGSNQQPLFSWFMNVSGYSPGFPGFVPHIAHPGYYSSPAADMSDMHLFSSTYRTIVANSSNPFFRTSSLPANSAPVIYKEWQCVEYDLSLYVGKEVSIFFKVKDCALSQHFGYAYIDGLCDALPAIASFSLNKTQMCNDGQPLIMNGTASTGEDRYFVEIAESYNSTGTSLNTANIVSGWMLGATAGIVNLSAWYAARGGEWKCNTYYKIKLAVSNDCAPWNEQNEMLFYSCPTANAGPDRSRCCGDTDLIALQIGTPPTPGLSYSWSSLPTGFSSTLPQTITSPNVNTTYSLTVTDASGCKATDAVDIIIKSPIDLSIAYNPLPALDCSGNNMPINCNGRIEVTGTPLGCGITKLSPYWIEKERGKYTYLWSTGETTYSITPHTGITDYTVTVSNGCNTASISIAGVVENNYFAQTINSIGAPTGIKITDPNPANRVCKFFEYGPTAPLLGTGPAYHAFKYRLRVFDRWGNTIRFIYDCRASGFLNGEIQWDGRNDNGLLVEEGVYVLQLTLWNCHTPDEGTMNFEVFRGRRWKCTKHDWWPPFACSEGHWEDTYGTANAFGVTVIY